MIDSHQMKCVASRAGEPTVTEDEIQMLQVKKANGVKQLDRVFEFEKFLTHKIGGLHKNDFIMAVQTDDLFESL